MATEKFLPTIRIKAADHAALKKSAKANERTLAAEVRVAIAAYLGKAA